jgi:glycine/D-amino acid oxidase-like deaminating enzyme
MNEYCDLVVVGAGGAGLSAAIHAAKSGLKVIVLEKNDEAGGTTGWSVGSFTASGTIHQKKAGILDNPDDHFDDMDKLIARQIEKKIDGIVLHGTTSEISTISDEEQINILNNLALKYLNKIKIMIGVGGNNTKDVENNIKLFSKYCNRCGSCRN